MSHRSLVHGAHSGSGAPHGTTPDTQCVIVLASDGINTGSGISDPFSVPKKAPLSGILFPQTNAEYRVGDLVWLQGLAFDVDDGVLADDGVTWTSSLDGTLGTGANLPFYDLSVGTHTITLTVEDSDGNESSDSVVVTVSDTPIIEEPAGLKGDVDCDGDVDAVDGLKELQYVAGLAVSQEAGCPAIGAGVGSALGDVDCDDDVDSVDALEILKFVAALPVNLPAGCPPFAA